MTISNKYIINKLFGLIECNNIKSYIDEDEENIINE